MTTESPISDVDARAKKVGEKAVDAGKDAAEAGKDKAVKLKKAVKK